MKKVVAAILLITSSLYMIAAEPVQTKPAQDPLKASVNRGSKVYAKVCLTCHMADGGGVPRLNPPLAQTAYVTGDKSKLIWIVLKGMSDRVPIEDEYYSNNMAPHADLTDVQIADVLTYVRNSFGNTASAVTPAEVKAVRAKAK